MGGIDMREAHGAFRQSGVHIIVATPGRLKGELGEKRFALGQCRYLCLDEADRMVDQGFEEDIRLVRFKPPPPLGNPIATANSCLWELKARFCSLVAYAPEWLLAHGDSRDSFIH